MAIKSVYGCIDSNKKENSFEVKRIFIDFRARFYDRLKFLSIFDRS